MNIGGIYGISCNVIQQILCEVGLMSFEWPLKFFEQRLKQVDEQKRQERDTLSDLLDEVTIEEMK